MNSPPLNHKAKSNDDYPEESLTGLI